ncbi:uncharacterized protein TNCV_2034841 [Trichonephila clavipes]|nr:uncharacterized protein TNCV_2034841 [Trichonephila clavipes]
MVFWGFFAFPLPTFLPFGGDWWPRIPLRSLWPTLHCRRVAGVSPLLSIGWWYLSSVSPKRDTAVGLVLQIRDWRVYPLDPRPDSVTLYSGCTPGKRRAWFFAR